MTLAVGTTPCNWQALHYQPKLLNSYSSSSSSSDGSSSTVMPASSCSSGSSSTSSSSPNSARPLATLPETLWSGGTFSFPPCSSRTIQSLPIPAHKLKPPTIPIEYNIQPVAGFDDFTQLFTIPEDSVARTRTSSAGAPTSFTRAKTTHKQRHQVHYTPKNSHLRPLSRPTSEEPGSINTVIFRRERPFSTMGSPFAMPDRPSHLSYA